MSAGRLRAAGALAVAGSLALAGPAAAHGLVGKQDLPIPRWLFGWAAAVVLVVSFVGLAVLWPTPRLAGARQRTLLTVPLALEVLCGALGVAAFAGLVYAAFAGTQSPGANIVPTTVFVLFWVGLAFASLLLGDVFAAFNPWRATGRAIGWALGRIATVPEALPYPARLGHWPAAAGIAGFVWIELIYSGRDRPSSLMVLALIYAALQLLAMSLFGTREWARRGDAFGVYFGLFASLSPLNWERRTLRLRAPLTGTATITATAGTVALLCVMIGTTSFDGLTASPLWNSVLQDGLVPFYERLGLSLNTAVQAGFTTGLVAMVCLIAALYALGCAGIRTTDRASTWPQVARRFSPSLVPIALAYVMAHYFGLLAYQGQAIAYLASDPLGDGSDLLGTATTSIDYTWVSATAIWYVQVGVLVLGHAAGLALAHDRALIDYGASRQAVRSQYWMLGVMIAFTSLALWLLSGAA